MVFEESISTKRLVLRAFAPSDFDAVHAYASDPIVTRYTSFGPNSVSETRAFLERCRATATATPRRDYNFAVVERRTGELIGGCGLAASDATLRQYAFGYCFRSESWGQGFGAEAASALVEFGFRTLSAHRLWAYVFVGNEASIRILQRLRFRQEGRTLQSVFARDAWHDTVTFARLRSE